MNEQNDSTGVPGGASASQYDKMSVWNIYQVLTTLVGVKQFYNLLCCAEPSGETAVFEWAEAREAEVDHQINAMAQNLAARIGLTIDEEDARDMAFARIDGYVPSGIWHDGRVLRMRSAAELAVTK